MGGWAFMKYSRPGARSSEIKIMMEVMIVDRKNRGKEKSVSYINSLWPWTHSRPLEKIFALIHLASQSCSTARWSAVEKSFDCAQYMH